MAAGKTGASANKIPQLLSRAIALHQAGNLADAEVLYRRIIASDGRHAQALSLLGTIHLQRGHLEEGVRLIGMSLDVNPHQPDALNNRGNALQKMKRYDEALASYDQAIALQPGDAETHNNRGATLQEMMWFGEALASYDKAIALKPDYAKAYYNRGNLLQDIKRYEEALASYDKAIRLKPGYAEAHNNRGITLQEIRRFDEALASYGKAIALRPDYAEAYCNRSHALREMKRYEEALASYDQAITLKPDNAELYNDRGIALQEMKRYDEALASYEKAMVLGSDTPYLLGKVLYTRMLLCHWQGMDTVIDALAEGIGAGKPVSSPFAVLATPLSAAQQLACAELYIQNEFPPAASTLWNGEKYVHDRIRIGYFSADFRNHPLAYLMVKMFELHDRSKFEVTAFSFGPPSGDAMRKRLENTFEHFIDVQDKSDAEIAALVRRMEIDIAIDRNGFTQDARTGIFAQRPAPVQVNYLAYPGTMGASYIDYLIADHTVIPEEHRRYYTENIVYLPDSYQVNDSSRRISDKVFRRGEMGLPEEGFVFCCFNNSFKLTPDAFDIWMRLLHKVEGSILWLLEANPTSTGNLRAEAKARGIAEDRLVFAKRMELADHLARHRLADLFLDCFYYDAHTTASDALWTGLPVVTCPGEPFASRVAASLLNAAGLPELITGSREAYEALALDLATQPKKLAAVRHKLSQNRLTCPLFDTERFTRHIETAYTQMWERYQAGLEPVGFAV